MRLTKKHREFVREYADGLRAPWHVEESRFIDEDKRGSESNPMGGVWLLNRDGSFALYPDECRYSAAVALAAVLNSVGPLCDAVDRLEAENAELRRSRKRVKGKA